MMKSVYRVFALMAILSVTAGCSSAAPNYLGVQSNGALAPCPSSPNCVSSFSAQSDKTHYIAPFRVDSQGWGVLRKMIAQSPRMKIVSNKADYLRVEATTLVFRFVDDLEFLYQPSEGLIQLRSASRVGYSDLGKNRRRLEGLRDQLRQAGVLSK